MSNGAHGAFKRTVMPGSTSYGRLFVRIEFDGRRLGIVGVEGPMTNGDARGSSGQCIKALDRLKAIEPPFTVPQVQGLKAAWERWHLNDMRAGCEHQRATWDVAEELAVVSYKLTTEAYYLRERVRDRLANAAYAGDSITLTPIERALAGLDDWFKARFSPPDADSPLNGCYEVEKRETKTAGWVRPDEHPRGLLTRPCEVCGYKYGTQWLFEAVPLDVLEWLEKLPESEVPCPWRNL